MANINKSNPLQSIYDKCNQGNSYEKLHSVPTFPRYFDVELTNVCNFKCLMCPVGVGSISMRKGFMADEVFYKMVEEIAKHKAPVRFIRWGEPFLHPRILKYVEVLKDAGLIVHINTNGSMLNEDLMEKLIDLKLDSLKFSFQGVDRESYKEMRNIDFFDELIEKIKKFHAKRQGLSPFVHVSTTITYETADQVEKFRESLRSHVDQLSIGRTVLEHIDPGKTCLSQITIEKLMGLKQQESVVKKHPQCPEVFDKLSINWDGTVSACCGDYDNYMVVGDVKISTLSEIWQSEKMANFRSTLANMGHKKIKLCSTCYDYHGLQTPGLQKI